MNKGYRLVSDDACHRYIIPADKIEHWNKWLDEDGGYETDVPDYVIEVNLNKLLILEYKEL